MEKTQEKSLEVTPYIRKRPGMYVGSIDERGVLMMIDYLLGDLAEDLPEATLEVEVMTNSRIAISARNTSMQPLRNRLYALLSGAPFREFGFPVLMSLCQQVELKLLHPDYAWCLQVNKGNYREDELIADTTEEVFQLCFEPDRDIFKFDALHYNNLNKLLRKYAFLNPGLKIFSNDLTGEYQRHLYYYPKGLGDALDLEMAETLPYSPSFKFDFATERHGYRYQVSFAMAFHETRNLIRSYANSDETYLHGSLVDGVLDGIIGAMHRFAGEQKLVINIDRNMLKKKLILFAAVKGEDMVFSGPTRTKLDVPGIKKDIQKCIEEEVLLTQLTDPEAMRHLIKPFLVDDDDEYDED